MVALLDGTPAHPLAGGTPDWDSARGIGHINGRAFNLDSPGPQAVAMKAEYARRQYPGIEPGGTFISVKDGKPHRWMDTSGARNANNEDFYKGASARSDVNVTFNIQALDDHGVDAVLREHGDKIAAHVKRAFRNDMADSSVV